MKKLLSISLLSLLLVSCGKEVSIDKLQTRGGKFYEINHQKPFSGKVFYKLPNGQILLKGKIDDGLRDGKWVFYHKNGALEKEINYKDGKEDGKVELFDFNGKKRGILNFKDGKLNGEYKIIDSNGTVTIDAHYLNGKLDGNFKQFAGDTLPTSQFKSGALLVEKNYKNGLLNGPSKEFYGNGKLQKEGNFINNEPNGTFKIFSLDGKLMQEYNFKNGIFDGICKDFYPNGKLSQSISYKNGKKDGTFKLYSISGELAEETNYKLDKKDGISKLYYTTDSLEARLYNGDEKKPTKSILKSEITYSNDILNGNSKFYSYPSGNLVREENYKMGVPNGVFKEYHKNGKLHSEATYLNGSITNSKTFDESGTLVHEIKNNIN